jgi:RNA polymerase sigma-70 factor (ECF subfamily)
MTADPVAGALRDALGPATAALVRAVGDLDVADDMIQDAAIAALERWPADGIPERPELWLVTVARNRAIDRWRRDVRLQEKLAGLERAALQAADDPGDDWLSLVFCCCHPALAREAQVALTLRAVCGLTVAQIAAAFLAGEATIAQRIVRAKRKIVRAGVAFRVPSPEHLPARLDEVLAVLYLMFNEGYLATDGAASERTDLAESAEWLTAELAALMPREPEVLGLLALIRLHRARRATRFDADGRLLPLRHQDRTRWDHDAIAAAADLVVRASRLLQPGPYQLQAAIVACHAEAPTWEQTDWLQILLLYDELLRRSPTPVARLNRAIALRYVAGPDAALAEIDALADTLEGYHLLHATHAALLRDLDRLDEARLADQRALTLTTNPAERALLEQRLG